MTRKLTTFLILSVSLACAQVVKVNVEKVSPTQAIIHTVATNANGTPYTGSACTVRAFEDSAPGTLLHDVDSTLFTGSNLDTRPGSRIAGANRWFVLGTRDAEKASDNKFYSRALQAATSKGFGITCGGASEVLVHFATSTIPLGNSYPEYPKPDSTSWNGYGSPDIDLNDVTKTYTDPLSGVLIKRVTSANDVVDEFGTHAAFNTALDLSGGAGWTNIGNASNNSQSTSTFASSSVAGSSIFLPFPAGIFYHGGFGPWGSPGDIKLRAFLRGSGNTVTTCLVVDSHTCATSANSITVPSTFAEVDYPSSGFPSNYFLAWGNPTFNTAQINTLYDHPNVSVTGTALTTTNGFVVLAAGSKLLIPGTSPSCTSNLCTVSTVNSTTSITIVENVASPVTNVSMTYQNAGVLVKLVSTSGTALDANFTFDWALEGQFWGSQDASFDMCNVTPITVSNDAQGGAITPVPAYLCAIGPAGNYEELILWIPSRFESRLISSYYNGTALNKYHPSVAPFDATNGDTVYVSDNSSNLWKGVLTSTLPYVPDYTLANQLPGNLTWTQVGAASSLTSQVIALGGSTATMFQTGAFGGTTLGLQGFVGGYAYYRVQNSQDFPCIQARVDPVTFTVKDVVTSFDAFPARWGGCHIAAFGAFNWEDVNVNPLMAQDTSRPAGGPFRLDVTALHHTVAGLQAATKPITSVTIGNPTTFTATGTAIDYGYSNKHGAAFAGPKVTIAGATNCSGINGSFIATVTATAEQFTIPFDSSGCGTVTGSLTVTTTPPLARMQLQSITNATPSVVTYKVVGEYTPTAAQTYGNLVDGDSVTFFIDSTDSNTASYYAKVTGNAAGSFGLYNDSALTQPAGNVSIPVNSNFYFAEDCASLGVVSPWNDGTAHPDKFPFDTGASGKRCVQFKVSSEPYSLYPGPGEHSAFPCADDPSNTGKSCLQPTQLGDMIHDIGIDGTGNFENLVLVAKSGTAPNILLTFLRWANNKQATTYSHPNGAIYDHPFGTTWFMTPTSPMSWVDINDSTHTFVQGDPYFTGQHADFGYGNASGLFTFSPGVGFTGGALDAINNVPFSTILSHHNTFTAATWVPWTDSGANVGWGADQSYPGHRQKNAPTATDFTWSGDWQSLNPASGGTGPAAGVNIIDGGNTLTLVAGTVHTYKGVNVFGAMDRKKTPTYAWTGYRMLADMSGPGSVIDDTKTWTYCIADFAGECRSGSAQGDVFMSLPMVDNTGLCDTNSYDSLQPCLINLNAKAGWAVQNQIDPVDTTGRNFRKLTLGFAAPGMHFTFQTWLQAPDGATGFFTGPYPGGRRNDEFAMKLPPWPGVAGGRDDVDRSTFVNYPVKVGTFTGATYGRIRFGYVENGSDTAYYCSQRLEACSTEIPTGSPSDPYSFVSEAATHVALPATINVPAIAGRVLYTVTDYLNGSGTVIKSVVNSPVMVRP